MAFPSVVVAWDFAMNRRYYIYIILHPVIHLLIHTFKPKGFKLNEQGRAVGDWQVLCNLNIWHGCS